MVLSWKRAKYVLVVLCLLLLAAATNFSVFHETSSLQTGLKNPMERGLMVKKSNRNGAIDVKNPIETGSSFKKSNRK